MNLDLINTDTRNVSEIALEREVVQWKDTPENTLLRKGETK